MREVDYLLVFEFEENGGGSEDITGGEGVVDKFDSLLEENISIDKETRGSGGLHYRIIKRYEEREERRTEKRK